jgi:preprotein translocase subunit SecG
MYLFVVALHVILCVFLILIIILQPGKGGDIGAAFGGGSSSTVFGPRGPTGLLQRATTVVAVMFMCTSITLALYSNQKMLADADIDEAIRVLQEEQASKKVADSEEGSEPSDVPSLEEANEEPTE